MATQGALATLLQHFCCRSSNLDTKLDDGDIRLGATQPTLRLRAGTNGFAAISPLDAPTGAATGVGAALMASAEEQ
jgi:hypothetical protein